MIGNEVDARSWLARLEEWNPSAEARIEILVERLRIENERQNLVAARSLEDVWRRHVVDSAQLLKFVPRGTSCWLDLGTGAGFPGLVIAALRPKCAVTLVESRARRIAWLTEIAAEMGLSEVAVIGQSLEKIPSRKFAVISARAFAPLQRLLDLSARFSTADTIWVLPKGRSAQQELEALPGKHAFHVEQSVTDADSGIIVGHLSGRKDAA